MASVYDVARYILERRGPMSAMKLQKLVYYSQAWSLVWDEEALFDDDFQAWANGPVVRSLYDRHRGQFKVHAGLFSDGEPETLDDAQRETVDIVLDFYGDRTAQWLSDLTHREAPWVDARGELDPMERCDNVITKAAMHEYYSAL